MQLLFDWYPSKFDFLRNASMSISQFIDHSIYGIRQIETFEWLVSTFNIQFTDIDTYSDLGKYLAHDNAIAHWMIVNHIDKVTQRPTSDYRRWLFNFILENYESRTMQAYIAVYNIKDPKSLLSPYMNNRQIGLINYLHSLIHNE